jgi:hypothetical protein
MTMPAKGMDKCSFFRWLPTAIILWVFAVIFAAAAIVSLLDARQAAHGHTDPFYAPILAFLGDTQHAARWFLGGAIANGLAAALCILGWDLMRRRLPALLALGGIAVALAAGIIGQRSLIYLFRGAGLFYWIDLVLEVPFLLYTIIYAYRECRKPAA